MLYLIFKIKIKLFLPASLSHQVLSVNMLTTGFVVDTTKTKRRGSKHSLITADTAADPKVGLILLAKSYPV